MDFKIIYENNDVLVVDKPAEVVVFPENERMRLFHSSEKAALTLIDYLIEKYPELKSIGEAPRYGIVHRLDKDTSGVLLVAKSTEALKFLQNQFINRKVEKKYICLAEGVIKQDSGEIKTLMARSSRDQRKQTVYELDDQNAPKSAREAITEYNVFERFKDYTLLEVQIKTGRKHQIRCHLSYLHHPVAGDKLYGFKNSPVPDGLTRQFLHAKYLKIQLPFDTAQGRPGEVKEFLSELPEELSKVINNLEKHE